MYLHKTSEYHYGEKRGSKSIYFKIMRGPVEIGRVEIYVNTIYHLASIEMIKLRKWCRGKGWGTVAFYLLLKVLKRLKVTKVTTDYVRLSSYRWWKHLGFRTTSIRGILVRRIW